MSKKKAIAAIPKTRALRQKRQAKNGDAVRSDQRLLLAGVGTVLGLPADSAMHGADMMLVLPQLPLQVQATLVNQARELADMFAEKRRKTRDR